MLHFKFPHRYCIYELQSFFTTTHNERDVSPSVVLHKVSVVLHKLFYHLRKHGLHLFPTATFKRLYRTKIELNTKCFKLTKYTRTILNCLFYLKKERENPDSSSLHSSHNTLMYKDPRFGKGCCTGNEVFCANEWTILLLILFNRFNVNDTCERIHR